MLYGYLVKTGYMGRIGFDQNKDPIYIKFPTEQEYKEYMEDYADENESH